jgi:hypothetical protein
MLASFSRPYARFALVRSIPWCTSLLLRQRTASEEKICQMCLVPRLGMSKLEQSRLKQSGVLENGT